MPRPKGGDTMTFGTKEVSDKQIVLECTECGNLELTTPANLYTGHTINQIKRIWGING